MTAPRSTRIMEWSAVAAIVAAVLSSVYALRAMPERIASYNARLETFESVRRLAERDSAMRRAKGIYEAAAEDGSSDLATLVARVAPGDLFRIEPRASRPLEGGWTLAEMSLSADSVPLDAAGRLIEFLEGQRPPWRLVSCEMAATGEDRGRVRLTVQSAVKAPEVK